MPKLTAFTAETLKKAERRVIWVLSTVFGISLLAGLIIGGPELIQQLGNVPAHGVALLLVGSFVENLIRIYRYRVFANTLRLNVPWGWLMTYYVAGMALLPTPGKVGITLRLWLLKQHHGILYRRSTPMLVMDVLTDTLAMMAIIALGIIVLGDSVGAIVGFMVLGGLVLGTMTIFAKPRLARRLVKLAYRLGGRRTPRTFATLLTLFRLLNNLMGWRVLLTTTFMSFIAWMIFGMMISYFIIAMDHDVPWILGGFALCVGTILGFLTMAPAGVGGAEASMTAIIHSFDVPLTNAFIITMIGRIAAMWIPVGIGFIALPFALRGPKKPLSK